MTALQFENPKSLIRFIIVALIVSLAWNQAKSNGISTNISISDSTLNRLTKLMPKGFYVINESGFQKVVDNQLKVSALEEKLKLTEKSLLDARVQSFSSSQKLEQSEKNLSVSLQFNSQLTKQITGLKIQKWGLVGIIVYQTIKSFSQ